MYCEKCGAKQEGDEKFCVDCGNSLTSKPISNVGNNTNNMMNKSKKILGSIGAVLIFFAVFGVARWLSYGGTKKAVEVYDDKKADKKVKEYFSDNSEWKKFESSSGSFSAEFPIYPTTENEDLTIENIKIKYTSYSAETLDGTTYMIGTTIYPSEIDMSNYEGALDGSLNGMLPSNDGNKLVSSNLSNYKGNHSMDYSIYNNAEDIYMKGRAVLSRQSIYLMMVAYKKQNYNESNYNKFVDSIVIK